VKRKPETDNDNEKRSTQAQTQSDTEPFDVPTTAKIALAPLVDESSRSKLNAIQRALEGAGIVFVKGNGARVRLRER
jgi:hypothetical protein